MAGLKIQVVDMAVEATATPLHDGSNSQGHPYYVSSASVQVLSETDGGATVNLGDSTVTDSERNMVIKPGRLMNLDALRSRGTHRDWDLREIYYVGGPFKLVIEKRVK